MAKMSLKGMPMPEMKKKGMMEEMPEMEDMPEGEDEAGVEIEVKQGPGPDLTKLPDEAIIAEMRKRGLLDEAAAEGSEPAV